MKASSGWDVNISRVAANVKPLELYFLFWLPPTLLYLELPMCRLQKLLRLVCRTTRRQDELVNHDLMFEFIHFRRSPCPTRGGWLWSRLSTVFSSFFTRVVFRSLCLSRPPLQPVEQTQIFTVGAVVEGTRLDWQKHAANHVRAPPVGLVCRKGRVSFRRVFIRLLPVNFDTYAHIKRKLFTFVKRFENTAHPQCEIRRERGLTSHRRNLRKGLFWTTNPVSTRFVCKVPEGEAFCEWRPLSSNSQARCVATSPNMVNKSTIANYIAPS